MATAGACEPTDGVIDGALSGWLLYVRRDMTSNCRFKYPTWSYILVTPENIGQIPRTMLDNNFITGKILANEMQRLDFVRVGFGGEWRFKFGVLFGMKMYGRVE